MTETDDLLAAANETIAEAVRLFEDGPRWPVDIEWNAKVEAFLRRQEKRERA